MPSISRCKCVMIGEAGVGKTAIIKSLLGPPHNFPKKYVMTTGVEIFSKPLRIPDSEDTVELYIYDFSGKSLYKELVRKMWSSNVSLVVGVFDVTKEETFYSLQNTLTDLLKQMKNPEEVVGLILGNKVDISGRRFIKSEEAHQLAKRYKMRYYDCSAKDRENVEEAFQYLATVWHQTNGDHE